MPTDDEIKALALKHCDDNIEFARAIIAAYQDKLRQGVELPGPSVLHDGAYCFRLHQLQQYGDARDQAGYLRGLEDAKRVCIGIATAPSNVILGVAVSCADAIDKLKVKK